MLVSSGCLKRATLINDGIMLDGEKVSASDWETQIIVQSLRETITPKFDCSLMEIMKG